MRQHIVTSFMACVCCIFCSVSFVLADKAHKEAADLSALYQKNIILHNLNNAMASEGEDMKSKMFPFLPEMFLHDVIMGNIVRKDNDITVVVSNIEHATTQKLKNEKCGLFKIDNIEKSQFGGDNVSLTILNKNLKCNVTNYPTFRKCEKVLKAASILDIFAYLFFIMCVISFLASIILKNIPSPDMENASDDEK